MATMHLLYHLCHIWHSKTVMNYSTAVHVLHCRRINLYGGTKKKYSVCENGVEPYQQCLPFPSISQTVGDNFQITA